MNHLTAKLMNHLTDKLVDRSTAKLVVVNFVKLHLTKFIVLYYIPISTSDQGVVLFHVSIATPNTTSSQSSSLPQVPPPVPSAPEKAAPLGPRPTLVICPLSVLSNWQVNLKHQPTDSCHRVWPSDNFSRIFGREEKQVCRLVCLDTCKVRKSEK